MPWTKLNISSEQVSLVWESKYLRELGTAIDRLVGTAIYAGVGEVLKMTALSGLIASLALPAAVLSATNLVDNPWSVCTKRARAAGEELAQLLKLNIHGKRPVSLIGCSSGALVVWSCMKELKKCGAHGMGIISDVIILGAPISTKSADWEEVRPIVSGRLINGWTESDWVLGLLCHDTVAGTSRVSWMQQDDKRLVNIRLTGTISGHTDYQRKMGKILRLIDAAEEDFEIVASSSSLPSSLENSITMSSSHTDTPILSSSGTKQKRHKRRPRRSRSLSSLPKPKKRTSKLRKTRSLHNVAFSSC